MLQYSMVENKNNDCIYFIFTNKARGLEPADLQNNRLQEAYHASVSWKNLTNNKYSYDSRDTRGLERIIITQEFALALHKSRNDTRKKKKNLPGLHPRHLGKKKKNYCIKLSMFILSLAAWVSWVESAYRNSLKKAVSTLRSSSIIFSATGDTSTLSLSMFLLLFDTLEWKMSIIRLNSNFEWQIFNQIKASFAPATIWAFTKSWMLCTSLNLPISSGRLSGWGFWGNMVLYTMANVLVQKSRNSRTWAVWSWNYTIRRVWSSFAQKLMPLALASRKRAPTRKFTLSSSAAVSRNAPRRY